MLLLFQQVFIPFLGRGFIRHFRSLLARRIQRILSLFQVDLKLLNFVAIFLDNIFVVFDQSLLLRVPCLLLAGYFCQQLADLAIFLSQAAGSIFALGQLQLQLLCLLLPLGLGALVFQCFLLQQKLELINFLFLDGNVLCQGRLLLFFLLLLEPLDFKPELLPLVVTDLLKVIQVN